MKNIIAALLLALLPLTANAAWYARAESNHAWGEGLSPSKAAAREIALIECAARTPRYDTCFIVQVYWVD